MIQSSSTQPRIPDSVTFALENGALCFVSDSVQKVAFDPAGLQLRAESERRAIPRRRACVIAIIFNIMN
jgi:hypothetical protein